MDSSQPSRPKAFSYIRMSTEVQLKGDSLRRQREASKKFADARGLELDQEFDLHDIGVPAFHGQNIASGNFGRFLEAVRTDKIPKGSYLLVESFDRISRQEPIVALQPLMEIVNAGLVLVTLDDQREFSGKISFEDLIISIAKMSRANEESARKSDRLTKKWEDKRANVSTKKLTGRCPSWLRLSDDDLTFEILEERAAVVRRMFEDAIAGIGAYTIVRRLNEEKIPTFTGKNGWQTSTVNKVIGNPAVIGRFQPSRMVNRKREPEGEPILDYFPRILSDEKYYAAQRGRLARRTMPDGDRKGSGGRKGKQFSNLFSKLAICAYCKKPMQYENKGAPPKGQSYLVCSSALRKLECPMTGRWRYDHFETAFLTFVEQLDLASLVSTEAHASKRSELARELEAAQGKQKTLELERQRAWETGMKLGDTASDFLAQKIREYDPQIAILAEQQQELQRDIVKLDEVALNYYSSPDQISSLIAQVSASKLKGEVNDSDTYKLRAQIASRLQVLIKDLQLMLPLDEGDDQQFEVNFTDGAHLMVFVDPANPAAILKIVREMDGLCIVTDGLGKEIDRYTLDSESEVAGI